MVVNDPAYVPRATTVFRPLSPPSPAEAGRLSRAQRTPSAGLVAAALQWLRAPTVVPSWLLAVLLLGMVGTTGLLVYATSRDTAYTPDVAARVSEPSPVTPVRDAGAAAAAAEAAALKAQLSALIADLEQAERDSSMLFHLSREQSAELSETQAALQAAEQARVQEVQDLESRIAALEEQIDTVENLAARMRQLVGLPAGDDASGGPAVPANLPSDPGDAARARIEYAQQRVQALHAVLDEIDTRARARLAAVEQSGVLSAGIAPSVVAFSPDVPRGQPVSGPITSGFGVRGNPFGSADGEAASEMHTGIDFSVPQGTPVLATGAGVVRIAGWSGAYGNLVVIDHGNGISTYYGHNSSVLVSPGERVERGQVVALSGNTGRSTGAHVHYEIRVNGTPVDPSPFLALSP